MATSNTPESSSATSAKETSFRNNYAGTGARASKGVARDAVDAQHERFGGIKWGAAFFGWLCANGLAVLLIAALSAAGGGLRLTPGGPPPGGGAAKAHRLRPRGGAAPLAGPLP